MKTTETTSYPIQIWIAGDHAKAVGLCRAYCDENGLCVTVTPTTYVYTGGQEAGVVVGLINYGRFPSEPQAIFARAKELTMRLIEGLGQESASIQAPDKTLWISFRPTSIKDREGRSLHHRCFNCERPSTTNYDGDRMCESCAQEAAWRDLEEGDDISNLLGG